MAIASSSSIGAWVIWDELSWIWASIIAFSQVISALVPHLPHKNRIKTYPSLLNELEELMIKSESKWHGISDGHFSPTEINNVRFEIRTSKHKSLKKYVQTTIPTNNKFHVQAENSARDYFTYFYSA